MLWALFREAATSGGESAKLKKQTLILKIKTKLLILINCVVVDLWALFREFSLKCVQ